ncbi:MAG: 4Fe-4S binding protein [Candidatus Hermodarchaeota archaeon]
MYPRVKRIVDDNRVEISERFFTESYGIEIQKDKCIGCGLCIKACPNNVISSPDLEGLIRIKTEDLKPEIKDITKCSFCGTCVYICPLEAIKLKENGQPVELEDLKLISQKVVPKLKFELEHSEKFHQDIKKYFIGEISVNWDKCISCMSCVDVCPVSAFSKTKINKNDPSKSKKVSFEAERCIGCGTCARACNSKAITFNLKSLNYSGDFKERFWNSLIARIKTQ